MNIITRAGQHRPPYRREPAPGQYLTHDLPGAVGRPDPAGRHRDVEFGITTETGERPRLEWGSFDGPASETFTTDLHCVTKWSKLGTGLEGRQPGQPDGERRGARVDFALVHSTAVTRRTCRGGPLRGKASDRVRV